MPASKAPDLYEFLDYQEFLRHVYNAEKQRDPFFSYRVFANAVQIDASLLVKILQGKRHLSKDGIESMIGFLRLKSKKADYFRELVCYNKADDDSKIQFHFNNLLALRPAHMRQLESDQFRFFQHWYFPAIRAALDFIPYHPGDDLSQLGCRFCPQLSASQVQEAIEVLGRLHLIHPDSTGRLVPCEAHVSTTQHWQSAAVQEYQCQVMQMATQALELFPKTERDISTLTLSLDRTQLDQLRTIITDARSAIIRLVDSIPASQCDSVYQLNIQLFPVVPQTGSQP